MAHCLKNIGNIRIYYINFITLSGLCFSMYNWQPKAKIAVLQLLLNMWFPWTERENIFDIQ